MNFIKFANYLLWRRWFNVVSVMDVSIAFAISTLVTYFAGALDINNDPLVFVVSAMFILAYGMMFNSAGATLSDYYTKEYNKAVDKHQ